MEENKNLPAPAGMNFFENYGATASMTMITGTLIKFSKGDWLMGQDEQQIKPDREFTCVMEELMIGWTRWQDNKPTAQHMGRLVEGFTPPKREELGDEDDTLWDVGSDGKVRDPWQFTNSLILKNPGTSGGEESDLFTFSTSSRGGINCIGDLCKAYVRLSKEKGPGSPIIKLGQSSYKHPNPEFGRIKKPVLEIVGWEPKTEAKAEVKAKAIEAPKEEAPAKKTAGKKK